MSLLLAVITGSAPGQMLTVCAGQAAPYELLVELMDHFQLIIHMADGVLDCAMSGINDTLSEAVPLK